MTAVAVRSPTALQGAQGERGVLHTLAAESHAEDVHRGLMLATLCRWSMHCPAVLVELYALHMIVMLPCVAVQLVAQQFSLMLGACVLSL